MPVTTYVDEHRARVVNLRTPSAGASAKQVMHFGQLIEAFRFQQYNYYNKTIMAERYGKFFTMSPPEIYLEKIPGRKVPIALFVGTHDKLADYLDTSELKDDLGPETVIEYELIPKF